jgi:trehalose 6-phosphate phosphatase
MKYLFSAAGIKALKDFCTTKTLVAFDYDGTLVALADQPLQAILPEEIEQLLAQLQSKMELAIVSGRSRADLKKLIPLKITMVGNHGLEPTSVDFKRWLSLMKVARWKKLLVSFLKTLPDVWVEDKKHSLSVHYRQARDVRAVQQVLLDFMKGLKPQPYLIMGKCVINLLPHGKVNKGTAVLKLMKKNHCSRLIFVGDDDTDEYALKLTGANFLTIRVGESRSSKAKYFIKNQSEIKKLLQVLLQ